MKIGGVTVTKCEELLVLPRTDGNLPFRAKAVSINDEFDKLVPLPVAPMLQTKDGKKPDYTDKNYLEASGIRDEQRYAYMVICSLEPSNIEWETVKLKEPNTWLKWSDELTAEGISEIEINRISNLVMAANSLDERKIEAALKDFLRGQGE